MIGRTEQLDQIVGAIGALGEGVRGPNVLFVTGEAGIGKSTLLAAVRQTCATLQPLPVVALAECSTPLAGQDIGEVESLQPWGEIMASLVTAKPERRHETSKLVGELALAWVRVIPVVGDVIESMADTAKIVRSHVSKSDLPSSAASQQQVFQQYINFLSKLAESGPLVLMIDDVHWADTASTNLLFAAARQLHGRPVLFILAYRPDDAASSRSGEGHPLLHVRNELERYDLALDIGVPRMTPDDLDALLHHRYPSYRNNDAFEVWIARVSAGNALFISQFLNTLEEDGFIDPAEGTIREGFESIRVPSSAAAVVKERIRRLSEEAREMLRYASVEGDTFTSAVLARITELPQLKLLQRLRLIEESHRVIRALGKQRVYARETSAFQFGHVLLHKSMYEDLGDEERELLHEAVLDVLKEEWELARSEGANVEGIAARIAVHASVLGQHLLAAEALIEGAGSTWREFSAEETLRLLDGALELLAQVTSPRDRSRAAIATGDTLSFRALIHRNAARFEMALADARAALDIFRVAGDEERTAKALVESARALRARGLLDEAESAARESLALAERRADLAGAFNALVTLGHVAIDRGRFQEALALYEKSRAAAREAADTALEANALDNLGSAHDSLGDYRSAAECYETSLRLSRSIHDERSVALVMLNLGVLRFRMGAHDEARAALLEALEHFRRGGDILNENACVVNLGILEFHAGNFDAATARADEAQRMSSRIGDRRGEAAAASSFGEIDAARGDLQSAREHFERALALQEEVADPEGIGIALLNLSETYCGMGDAARTREHAERARAIGIEIGSRFVESMAIGFLGRADAVAAESAVEPERAFLNASALRQIEECVAALEEIGNMYAETFASDLATLRSRNGASTTTAT